MHELRNNALSISATIITISVFSMEPHPRMPDWLDRLVCKSRKVEENPNSNLEIEDADTEVEGVDAIHKSQRLPSDIKTCSRCSGEPGKEQLDEKWRKVANFINKSLFFLFSVAFIFLICPIFAVWTLGAKSSSKISRDNLFRFE